MVTRARTSRLPAGGRARRRDRERLGRRRGRRRRHVRRGRLALQTPRWGSGWHATTRAATALPPATAARWCTRGCEMWRRRHETPRRPAILKHPDQVPMFHGW